MIPRIHKRGPRTIGLLAYLYGPGKAEEHVDPHIVASFDGMAPDPGRDPSVSLKPLERVLDRPLLALPKDERPKKHVWHCSVRAAATDRVLTDQEWGDIAHRMVAATGIDPTGDDAGCRWVAIRHADDHIHIIATLVREDGRRPDLAFDYRRAQAEGRRIERELGLRELNPGDGTAARRPTSAEHHKAKRLGHEATSRERLREAVRTAVAGASDEGEFFARLAAQGIGVRRRQAPSGDVTGYTVAVPGDRNRHGEPVWFSGSELAPDLSLPRIRRRFAGEEDRPAHTSVSPRPRRNGAGTTTGRPRPAQARHRASAALVRAAVVLDDDDDTASAAQLTGTGEILDALAQTASATDRRQLRSAAKEFERATRSHVRAGRTDQRALRAAAREIVYAGRAVGRGEDGAGTAMVLSTLILVVVVAARWHSAHHHAQQAAAARAAAEHLRAAYRNAAARPMRALQVTGRSLPPAVHARYAATIRTVLPANIGHEFSAPGWDALAATLAQAEDGGHDPEQLLADAVALRELNSADNTADVLVWRLRHLADLPAPTVPRRLPSGSATTTPGTTRPLNSHPHPERSPRSQSR